MILNIFLFPLSLIYGIAIYIRNFLYNFNVLQSTDFRIPIISIGNLTTGGTGKTPHTEYLISILKSKYKIAILSRGYGRKTNSFIEANSNSNYLEIGDEPTQIKRKFPDITVAVDKNRVRGMKNLLKLHPDLDLVILDDAFQHRAVKPNISILLTDYHKPFWENNLLPLGSLREPSGEVKRADMVIVTKTNKNLTPIEQRIIREEIDPKPYQSVFISYIKYEAIKPFNHTLFLNNEDISIEKLRQEKYTVLLFSGIANPRPLERYLKDNQIDVIHLEFPDHHEYTKNNLLKISRTFNNISNTKKIILTSEKDAIRLQNPYLENFYIDLPCYYITIKIDFHNQHDIKFENEFDSVIKENIVKNIF